MENNRPIRDPKTCDIDPNTCGGHCPGCGHEHGAPNSQIPGGLEGWKLALAAVGAFLVPLGTAMTGAVLSPESRRYLGAMLGLIAGVIVMAAVTKLIAWRWKVREDQSPGSPSADGTEQNPVRK